MKSAEHLLFENLPEIARPNAVADAMGMSVATIYDWHHRKELLKLPKDLFLKINHRLYVKVSALRRWVVSQNPHLS